jgi:hypothetical protein
MLLTFSRVLVPVSLLVLVVATLVVWSAPSLWFSGDDDVVIPPPSSGIDDLDDPAVDADASCENSPGTGRSGIHDDGVVCMGDSNDDARDFLKREVFGQDNIEYKSGPFLPMLDGDGLGHGNRHNDEEKEPNPFFSFLNGLAKNQLPALLGIGESKNGTTTTATGGASSSEDGAIITTLLERARSLRLEQDGAGGLEMVSLIGDAIRNVARQLERNFGDVLGGVDFGTLPIALTYYGAFTDRVLNPTRKRQLHRFYNKVTRDEMIQLHEGLYLSALAYCDTVDDFRAGLATFQDDNWELMYGTTVSLPTMPAHFLMIHKQLAPLEEPSFTQLFMGERETEVVVALVVRGTKHLSDALSDALLEPGEYKGGHAHGGILASGKALAEKHLPLLKEIHEVTGRYECMKPTTLAMDQHALVRPLPRHLNMNYALCA